MKRRDFLIASAMFASVTGRTTAQQVATKRLAFIHPSTKVADMRIGGSDPGFTIYLQELQRLGFVEGQNLKIERYSAEGQADRYEDLAREAVSSRPDLIAVTGVGIANKLKAVTTTIPVAAITGDPIRFGLVSSLAHPGGNITGVRAPGVRGVSEQTLLSAWSTQTGWRFVPFRMTWKSVSLRSLWAAMPSIPAFCFFLCAQPFQPLEPHDRY